MYLAGPDGKTDGYGIGRCETVEIASRDLGSGDCYV
jgi:hypothetical protein